MLLLGVGHESNTSLHVAEVGGAWGGRNVVEAAGAGARRRRAALGAMAGRGLRRDDFPAIGAAFAAETGLERVGPAGHGEARLMPQRELVAFARAWIDANRP